MSDTVTISRALLEKFLENALLPLENEIPCGIALNDDEVGEFVALVKTSPHHQDLVPMLERECASKSEVLITDEPSFTPRTHEITAHTSR